MINCKCKLKTIFQYFKKKPWKLEWMCRKGPKFVFLFDQEANMLVKVTLAYLIKNIPCK